jgi:hypothetical protein
MHPPVDLVPVLISPNLSAIGSILHNLADGIHGQGKVQNVCSYILVCICACVYMQNCDHVQSFSDPIPVYNYIYKLVVKSIGEDTSSILSSSCHHFIMSMPYIHICSFNVLQIINSNISMNIPSAIELMFLLFSRILLALDILPKFLIAI